jgi:hypothetical protein
MPNYQMNNPTGAYPGQQTNPYYNQNGTPSPMAVDPTSLSGLLNIGANIGANQIAQNQANNGMNGAIAFSQFGPTNIAGPYGGVTGTTGANGSLNYSLTPGSQFAPFGNLATNAGNYANSQLAGPNQFDTAANGAMSAFQNFNPNAFANNEYQQLTSMAAPGMTNQTQAMLNYEQRSGRGGLTQNGQLGDMGGLALAQQTADNQRRLMATQDARNQGNYLAGLGATFQNQANQNRLAGMHVAGSGLNDTLAINSSLQQMLQDSIQGSSQRALAGARQGVLRMQGGINQSNATGGMLGGLLQSTMPYGGPGAAVNGILNRTGASSVLSQIPGLGRLFSNNGSDGTGATGPNYGGPEGNWNWQQDQATQNFNANTDQYANNNLQNFGVGDSNYDASLASGYNPDTTGNPDWLTNDNLGGVSSDNGGGFNAAGGEAAQQAASNPQSTDNSAFAAFHESAPGYPNAPAMPDPQMQDIPGVDAGTPNWNITDGQTPGAATSPFPSFGQIGQGLNSASSALNVYNGLQRGGLSGYGGAALSAASLANQAGANIPGVGPAGNILGLYNGIRRGGVSGYGGAALNAASLASEAAHAGLLGSGGTASTLGALGNVALPVGLFMGLTNFAEGRINDNGALSEYKDIANTPQSLAATNAYNRQYLATHPGANPAFYPTNLSMNDPSVKAGNQWATDMLHTARDTSGWAVAPDGTRVGAAWLVQAMRNAGANTSKLFGQSGGYVQKQRT